MRLSHFAVWVGLTPLAFMPTWALACWGEVAQRYGVPAELLYAIGDQVSEGGELLTLEAK